MPGKSPGLESQLRARIAESGSIGFDEFMAAALYEPRHGFYAAERSRTGRRGDFFTSVSVGPVFGRLLAAQFLEMRTQLGNPDDFTLVEQGANDGQLMADILDAWPGHRPRVVIVEPLANLREIQRQKLAHRAPKFSQVSHENELSAFTGVFFANELLDAFPVKLIVRRGGEWFERRVEQNGEGFVFVETVFPGDTPPVALDTAEFHTEVCPSLGPWINTVASRLQRGWMLLVDYGHPARARYHPARAGGSLAAYRDHRHVENPLENPGGQDLTAHVDFSAVARAAEEAGLLVAGFTDQHHALTALAERVFPGMPGDRLSDAAAREMRALRQLMHPESMGTSFKFLALAKGADMPLAAFAFARDPREELFA
jgi:SAM-dependent MidA family methyltransferase